MMLRVTEAEIHLTNAPNLFRQTEPPLYEPDEVILNGQIHDHDARLKSFEIVADIMRSLDPVGSATD